MNEIVSRESFKSRNELYTSLYHIIWYYFWKVLRSRKANSIGKRRRGTLHYPIRGTGIPCIQI